MKRNINTRETLAWIILLCAAFLFSVTVAMAQEKSKVKSSKGNISISISQNEDGKIRAIDTTFDTADDAALQKILNDFGVNDQKDGEDDSKKLPPVKHRKMKVMTFSKNDLSEINREELKKEMEKVKEVMKEVDKKIKSIHIMVRPGKDAEQGEESSFDFDMPELPELPPLPGDADVDVFSGTCKGRMFHHFFFIDGADSLNDDEHVIIMGDENEKPPVFEKEITGKNGEKVFVYKRFKPENAKPKSEVLENNDQLKIYPNPNDGTFSVDFRSDREGELLIHVYDNQGKSVYAETRKDFTGEYSNKFDLSARGKGNYVLKISLGDQTSTAKFVIE